MATHSSILAWEMPWTEKPGGLQSTRSQRVRDTHTDQAYIISVLNPHNILVKQLSLYYR